MIVGVQATTALSDAARKTLEKVMNTPLPRIAALIFIFSSVPLLAETAESDLEQCLAKNASDNISGECAALRDKYLVDIKACMTERAGKARHHVTETSEKTRIGLRARYLLCERAARQTEAALEN